MFKLIWLITVLVMPQGHTIATTGTDLVHTWKTKAECEVYAKKHLPKMDYYFIGAFGGSEEESVAKIDFMCTDEPEKAVKPKGEDI